MKFELKSPNGRDITNRIIMDVNSNKFISGRNHNILTSIITQ